MSLGHPVDESISMTRTDSYIHTQRLTRTPNTRTPNRQTHATYTHNSSPRPPQTHTYDNFSQTSTGHEHGNSHRLIHSTTTTYTTPTHEYLQDTGHEHRNSHRLIHSTTTSYTTPTHEYLQDTGHEHGNSHRLIHSTTTSYTTPTHEYL